MLSDVSDESTVHFVIQIHTQFSRSAQMSQHRPQCLSLRRRDYRQRRNLARRAAHIKGLDIYKISSKICYFYREEGSCGVPS